MKLKVNTILKLYSALVILMFGIYASEEAEIPSLDEATTPFYEVGYSAQNTTIPNINGDDNSVADISFTEHSEILKSNIYISTKKTFNNEQTQSLLKFAVKRFVEGNYERTIDCLKQVLKSRQYVGSHQISQDSWRDITLFLGLSYYQTKKPDLGIFYFNEALNADVPLRHDLQWENKDPNMLVIIINRCLVNSHLYQSLMNRHCDNVYKENPQKAIQNLEAIHKLALKINLPVTTALYDQLINFTKMTLTNQGTKISISKEEAYNH